MTRTPRLLYAAVAAALVFVVLSPYGRGQAVNPATGQPVKPAPAAPPAKPAAAPTTSTAAPATSTAAPAANTTAPSSAAKTSTTASPAATSTAASGAAAAFKPEELLQIVAPIALYPDSLLAQVLMASTYPLEIVQAARWQKENPDVKGDKVAKAMETQPWDASVKSLVAFPDVLTMMNDKLDWTQKLGDAFLGQQAAVMDAVQQLRKKAREEGHLKSSKEQVVKTEPAGSSTPTTIIIEQSDPQVVYVPTYNPTVVYGAWPYPAYPPYYYYPPYYVPGAAFVSFSFGMIVGGAMWGNCVWGGGGYSHVDIDINRYNNFNRVNHYNGNRTGNGNRGNWQHNPEHRQGVQYRDQASQQKYGKASDRAATQSREQFRGRADAGREQIAREGAGSQRDMAGNRIGDSSQGRDFSTGSRDTSGYRDLGNSSSTRDLGGGDSARNSASTRDSSSRGSSNRSSSGTFNGVNSGSATRNYSSRGGASRGGGGFRGGGGRR